MKKFTAFLLILISTVVVYSQATTQVDRDKERQREKEAEFEKRVSGIDGLRNVGKKNIIRDRYKDDKILEDKAKPIYRSSTKEERASVAPVDADLQKYAEFLDKGDTGLTKLVIDRGCDKGIEVLVSTEYCLKYTMPGSGSSFSFRKGDYSNSRFADLTFSQNRFHSKGLLIQGIFGDIGDIPLENVNLRTRGVSYLRELEAPEEIEELIKYNLELEKGISSEGVTFNRSVPLYDNNTYLLRSIAYRGQYFRTVENVAYNELDYDKRRDLIVAFRVVRYQSNDGITILWKVLSDQKSPKLDLRPKDQR